VHRRHHEHADSQDDPHSPLVSFFWGHVGWMLVENRDLARLGIYDRYAKDILRDPFYRRLERGGLYPIIVLSSWAIFFLVGFTIVLLSGDGTGGAVRFGASLLIWGVFVRAVAVWHITWLVNSAAHLWGYRNYETGEDSRNNWFVAILNERGRLAQQPPRGSALCTAWPPPIRSGFDIWVHTDIGGDRAGGRRVTAGPAVDREAIGRGT
jgi:stearoyl-CoA desaturase (delta-9 desaturase)